MQLVSTHPRLRRRRHLLLAALPAAAVGLAAVHVARVALGPAGSWDGSAVDARLYAVAMILCGLAVFGRSLADRDDRAAWASLGIGLVGYGSVSIAAAPAAA